MAFAIYTDCDDFEPSANDFVGTRDAVPSATRSRDEIAAQGAADDRPCGAGGRDPGSGDEGSSHGWELTKENVKPLRRGRDVARLGLRPAPLGTPAAPDAGSACGSHGGVTSTHEESGVQAKRACVSMPVRHVRNWLGQPHPR